MASESELAPKGPERSTLIERLIDFFHIPFSLGCFILAIIFGPLGAIFLTYIQSSSINQAFSRTLCLFIGEELSGWQGVIALVLFSVILFYFLYMVRYMRIRLVSAKTNLVPILPEGEKTFHQVFSPISNLTPPLLIGTILIILVQLQTYPEIPDNYVKFAQNYTPNLVYIYIWLLFWLIVVGTFIWVYFGSIRGLYQMGTKSLKLKPFHEDKNLGTRPIGLLSLSLATIYIIGIGLAVLLVLILIPEATLSLFTGLLTTLILTGVIFFFLPLYSVHKSMVDAKNQELNRVRQEISQVLDSRSTESSEKDLGEVLDRLTKIIAVDVTKGELESIPTWPVDVPIISRLVTLLFSIIGILIANYLMRYLLKWG